MRKEVSIAIIIGIILGGIILYGIKIANDSTRSLNEQAPTPTTTNILPTPVESVNKKPKLTITSHVSGQVLFEKEIILAGKTLPNRNISFIWENDEAISKTNDMGEFNQKISLEVGENKIMIDIVDQNNQLESEEIKLYFSPKIINP